MNAPAILAAFLEYMECNSSLLQQLHPYALAWREACWCSRETDARYVESFQAEDQWTAKLICGNAMRTENRRMALAGHTENVE